MYACVCVCVLCVHYLFLTISNIPEANDMQTQTMMIMHTWEQISWDCFV